VHFSVEKGEADGRTFTQVERLDRERRREELARLSGGQTTAVMLKGAEELLATAEDYKTGAKKKP
ncbi:MAG: DNA repair protein RecN, partial [Oscillospiraceae bacterium]|nr:DNA repair protein RecN [Oscillospiraceae bacterium]